MFSVADNQLLATLILEIDDLETGIEDLNSIIELSLSKKLKTLEDEQDFINLMYRKNAYISAKEVYENKLKELELKAFKDNYNP